MANNNDLTGSVKFFLSSLPSCPMIPHNNLTALSSHRALVQSIYRTSNAQLHQGSCGQINDVSTDANSSGGIDVDVKEADTPKAGNKRQWRSFSMDNTGGMSAGSETREHAHISVSQPILKDGFYFTVCNNLNHRIPIVDKYSVKEYHLVVPQSEMHLIIDAVRFSYGVTIRSKSYSITEYNSCQHILEIHRGGIVLHAKILIEPKFGENVSLSLEDFQKEEMQKELDRKNKKKKRKSDPLMYNIKGTIDAISPILGVSANCDHDPFALMELYDQENDLSLTASVVIKGTNALVCQSGLHPGTTIQLKNVRRQKWHVPQSLQTGDRERLWHRAPSHVFVVSDPRSILWDAQDATERHVNLDNHEGSEKKDKNHDDNFSSLPLPSTVWPLASIQGRVSSVKYIMEKHAGKIIHYLILLPPTGSCHDESAHPVSIKLYLTYFPLSLALSLGIRKGALVRVTNIHKVNSPVLSTMNASRTVQSTSVLEIDGRSSKYLCFGACIRSTVSILETTSESEFSFDCMDEYANGMIPPHPVASDVLTHVFKQKKQSYFEIEWMSLARKLFSRRFGHLDELTVERTLKKLIAREVKAEMCEARRRKRDPYSEWFDHACDESPDDAISCTCEASDRNRFKVAYPCVISLELLKQLSMREMDNILSRHCEGLDEKMDQTDQVGIGCTASVHFNAKRLANFLKVNADTKIYFGGIVRDTNSHGQITKVESSSCIYNLSPILKAGCDSPRFLYEKGMFVLIKVHSVVVSCIYLGVNTSPGCTQCRTIDHTDLPPMVTIDGDNRSFGGPSRIVSIDHHNFAVSLQIQYRLGDVISLASSNEKYQNSHVTASKEEAMRHPGGWIGRLSRQRWRVRKETQHYYTGCQITVSYSNCSTTHYNCIALHMPQSTDIKLRIPLDLSLYDTFLGQNFLQNIPRRVLALASAWQYVAESQYSPLISGGWNELQDSFDREEELDEVLIRFPLNCDHTQAVAVDNLSFAFSSVHNARGTFPSLVTSGKSVFNYYGGSTFYKGMLDNRLCRKCIPVRDDRRTNYCEATIPDDLISGLPTTSIDTFQYMKSFTSGSKSVQLINRSFKIKNAHLSKIRFCRARAECSRCYKALIRDSKGTHQSFWHCPLPISTIMNKRPQRKKTLPSLSKRRRNTNLVCPSGCDRRYAYIKWELSGILKDYTGTAKLYSERETTILLLGTSCRVDVIEEGAWHCANGITYQAGLSLPAELSLELEKHKRNTAMRSRGWDVTSGINLSKEYRACYELHHHCSFSEELRRKMDFLCQPKIPKKDNSHVVQSTEISLVTAFGNEQGVMKSNDSSMMTAGIELILTDCFQKNDEENDEGWSIMNSILSV